MSAIIVGAGPSLDRDDNLLRLKNRPKGCLLFAVNTSVPALIAADVPIDFTVSVELLPVLYGKKIDPKKLGTLIVSTAANEHTVELAAQNNGMFLSGVHYYYGRSHEILDVEPLSHNAAITAAVRTAMFWEASQIVLIGCDMGWTADRVYAANTPWHDSTVGLEGDELVFAPHAERAALHSQFGFSNLPKRRPVNQIPAWGGAGTVYTASEFDQQHFSLARMSTTGSPFTAFINASRGGAHIDGWFEVALDDERLQLTGLDPIRIDPRVNGHPPTRRQVDLAYLDLYRQAAAMEETMLRALALEPPSFEDFKAILEDDLCMPYGLSLPHYMWQTEAVERGQMGEQDVNTCRRISQYNAARSLLRMWQSALTDRRVLSADMTAKDDVELAV